MNEQKNEKNSFAQNPPIKTDLIIEVLDKNGNVIKTIKKEEDLLVRNACRYIFSELTNTPMDIIDEGGATKTINADTTTAYNNAFPYGTSFHWRQKIAVGSDNTPPTFSDYALKNKIVETTALFVENVVEEGQYLRFDIRATFYFQTETSIGEAGLFGSCATKQGGAVYLVARDTLDIPIVVPADSYLVVRYRFYIGTL